MLNVAWLNSHYQTGLKNLLDTAVLEGVELDAARQLAERWQKVDEIPFDFERRRMSVVVSEQEGVHQLICKGALQEILNVSTRSATTATSCRWDETMLRRIRRVTDTLNRQGLRVVAVATRYLPAREGTISGPTESDLILEGYIAFLDPPKETTAPALKALKASGITVKILTGDSELVAAKVCHEVGLDAGEVVVGSQIEALSDDELAALAKRTTLFARLAPLHKERIVTLLKREGHVVGFMGDGINDAPGCARRTSGFPSTGRWISPARRRISSCWKRA
nr:magnesium-transporting ATPase MgtA [Raoultella sp. NCTC 9187]